VILIFCDLLRQLQRGDEGSGARIYNEKREPRLLRSISTTDLASMHVMSLTQEGEFVVLAPGKRWGQHERA
jgi:hypothetical protein